MLKLNFCNFWSSDQNPTDSHDISNADKNQEMNDKDDYNNKQLDIEDVNINVNDDNEDRNLNEIKVENSPNTQKQEMLRMSRIKQQGENKIPKKTAKFNDNIEEDGDNTVIKNKEKLSQEEKVVKLDELKRNVEIRNENVVNNESNSEEEEDQVQDELMEQNIAENLRNIKFCLQPFRDIQFEEMKEIQKKKKGGNNKRGKGEDEETNNVMVADIPERNRKLIEYLKNKRTDTKEKEKTKNEEQRTMINNYTNTDIDKMKNEVAQKRLEYEQSIQTDMKMLNIMILRDDIDCAGRRVYSLFFKEDQATLDNLKDTIYQYFGYERDKVLFYCFNKKFENKDKNIFTYMDENMGNSKDHVVYMLMMITTCKVPKFAREFFPLKSHVEIDLKSIMNYSNINSTLKYLDGMYNRNIYKEKELIKIERDNKYKYKEINDFDSMLPICEIDYNDITVPCCNPEDPLVFYELKMEPGVPEYLQLEDYTVPLKAINKLTKLMGEERGGEEEQNYVKYHEFLIKNTVWNRQRLQNTYSFFEDTYKRNINFDQVKETDIYSVFRKNDLNMLEYLRKFEASCFVYCTQIIEGNLKPETRTNVVFNDRIKRYLVNGIIIESVEPRACINHSLNHKNHVKKLYKNQIKIWEVLKQIPDVYIPYYTLLEVYGHFFFCYLNCELGSLSMFYGSSSGGMLFEVVDDDANDMSKKIAHLLNINTHKLYDYSMLDTKNINLSCNTEIHRLLYSYDNTDYFYYFPRVCDRDMPPDFNWIYQNRLAHDSYMGTFMLLRPELVMNYHNSQVKDGWIVCKWKDFIKCDYCKQIIYSDEFYEYLKEKDEYKSNLKQRRYCAKCFEDYKFRFDVPHDKIVLKTINKKQSEQPYYYHLESKQKQYDPPYTYIKTNTDVLYFYDSIYSEREMITDQVGNEEFLKMVNENESERNELTKLSKTLIEDNIEEFIALFEEGKFFLQVNNLNFVKFLHQYAINVRYLVVIFEKTNSVILRELILVEVMCRVLKEILYRRIQQNEVLQNHKNIKIKYYHNEYTQVITELVKDLYYMFDLEIENEIEYSQYIESLSENQKDLYLEMKEVCTQKYKAPIEFYQQEFNFQNLLYIFAAKYNLIIKDEFWLDQDYEAKYEKFDKTQILSSSPVSTTYQYDSLYVTFFINFLERMNNQIHKSLVEEDKYIRYLDWCRHFYKELDRLYDCTDALYVQVALKFCVSLLAYHNKGCEGIVEWNQVQKIEISTQLDEVYEILEDMITSRIVNHCLVDVHSLDILNLYADVIYVYDVLKYKFSIPDSLARYLQLFNEKCNYLRVLMFNQYLSEIINGVYNLKSCEILLKIAQAMYEADRCEEAAFLARKFMYSVAISYEEDTNVFKHYINKFTKIEYKVDSGFEHLSRVELIEKLSEILNKLDSELESNEEELERESGDEEVQEVNSSMDD